MKHRGRIQAQGDNVEESESWAQNNPPTKKEGFSMIERLKSLLSKREAQKRERAFGKAKKFIEQGPH